MVDNSRELLTIFRRFFGFHAINPVIALIFLGVPMNAAEQKRMQELCSAIAQEQDPKTLLTLVTDLNRLLALKEARLKQKAGSLPTSEPSDESLPL
jgi:hypothetical protein